MQKLKKSYITMTVVILSSFFVTVIIALNALNSQVSYTTERSYIEKQVHYNAYAGLQKAMAEIKFNKSYSGIFDINLNTNVGASQIPTKSDDYYTTLKVSYNIVNDLYTYDIESIGHGKFKEQEVSEKITAKIKVDYKEKSGIIKIDNINIG